MFETCITLCVKMSNSIVYYAVKSFFAVGEQLQVPILCKKKSTKKCNFTIFFLPVIKLAKLSTFRFYTPYSRISTGKIIDCLGAKPPCVWAGIIINKIYIKNTEHQTSLVATMLHVRLRSMEVWSSYVWVYLAHCVNS